MAEFDYKQRKATKEWETGHKELYGERCFKHPGEQKKGCPKCKELEKRK